MAVKALRAYIEKLQKIRDILKHERHRFFREKEAEYRRICAMLVQTAMNLVRPPETPAAEWSYMSRLVAASVASKILLNAEVAGLLIYVAPNIQLTNLDLLFGPGEEAIGKDTILSWVRAGREGDPAGKEFTSDDFDRSDQEIAGLVWVSMARNTATTTRDSVREYMSKRAITAFMPFLTQILKAWRIAMAERFYRDFRAWVRNVISNPRA